MCSQHFDTVDKVLEYSNNTPLKQRISPLTKHMVLNTNINEPGGGCHTANASPALEMSSSLLESFPAS